MLTAIVVVFVLAYLAIALEHPLKVNKSASALIGAGLLWTIYVLNAPAADAVVKQLNESVTGTAQIVFFLIAAMTVVEVVDAHGGFRVITSRISTTRLDTLMWIVVFVTFFLSAILDNMTTAIVMVSLMKKLLDRREDRLFFAGLIVIAANAGGAWTPIGDVTTTMLWIGGQITSVAIMKSLLIPSLVSVLVPALVIARVLKGKPVIAPQGADAAAEGWRSSDAEARVVFAVGMGALIGVPAFKTWTGLPPFLGLLFGLGLLWLIGELMHRGKSDEDKEGLTLASALNRIDMGSITFFIGILLAVAALEHTHLLSSLADWLDRTVGRLDLIVILIGLVSAVVDNVPLVAASMGMYSLERFPTDSFIWEFLAYCAGTGGSILIIGSAAGVATMGLEKIDFLWYARKISFYALIGYFAGAICYIAQYNLLH